MPNMKSEEYWCGKPGTQYGIWNDVKKEFQFGICEDTPALAEARLGKQKIRDSHKWRFSVRRLPNDPLHRAKVLANDK